MAIMMTSSVDTSIQLTSPLLGTGPARPQRRAMRLRRRRCGRGRGQRPAACRLGRAEPLRPAPSRVLRQARAREAQGRRPRARIMISFFMVVVLLGVGRQRASLPVSPVRMRTTCSSVADEDLAVADLAGAGRAFDGLDHTVDDGVVDRRFDLHLGQEVDDVLGAAVQLGVALLAPEALHLGHRDALHADAAECFTHFVELERLDDGSHHLHGHVSSSEVVLDAKNQPALPRFLPFGPT
jgi:hypothetical protein